MSYSHILRWIRLQKPRILPEAIEATVLVLLRRKLIEQDGERLRARVVA